MFFSQSENFACDKSELIDYCDKSELIDYCDKSELIEPIHFEYSGAIFKSNLGIFKKDL